MLKKQIVIIEFTYKNRCCDKKNIAKQTDMNLTYIEFLDCACSSRLRRLNLNFSSKIKIPTLQITNPMPLFKTLKSIKKYIHTVKTQTE